MCRVFWIVAIIAWGCTPAEPVHYILPGWDEYCDIGVDDDGACRSAPLDMTMLRDGNVAMFREDGLLHVVQLEDGSAVTLFKAPGGDRGGRLHLCDVNGDGAEEIVVGYEAHRPYTFYATDNPSDPYEGRLWAGTIAGLGCADFDDDGYDDFGGVHVEVSSAGSSEQGPYIVVRGTDDGLTDRGTSFALPVYEYAVTATHRTEACGSTMVASTGLLANEVVVSEYFPDTGFSSATTLSLGGTAKRMRLLEVDEGLLLLVLIRPGEDQTSLEVFRRLACDGNAFTRMSEHPLGRVLDWEVDHATGQVLLVDAGAGTIRVFQWTDPDGLVPLDEFPALATSATFFDDGNAHGVLWSSVSDPFLAFSPLE